MLASVVFEQFASHAVTFASVLFEHFELSNELSEINVFIEFAIAIVKNKEYIVTNKKFALRCFLVKQ